MLFRDFSDWKEAHNGFVTIFRLKKHGKAIHEEQDNTFTIDSKP